MGNRVSHRAEFAGFRIAKFVRCFVHLSVFCCLMTFFGRYEIGRVKRSRHMVRVTVLLSVLPALVFGDAVADIGSVVCSIE